MHIHIYIYIHIGRHLNLDAHLVDKSVVSIYGPCGPPIPQAKQNNHHMLVCCAAALLVFFLNSPAVGVASRRL